MIPLPHDVGLLLIGHGTRSEQGTRQFLQLGDQFARRIAPTPLESAFLELQQPSIAEAIQRLVAKKIERLIVMPLLLFAAGHAKRDIPQAVKLALESCCRTELPWTQTAPLGLHPSILELSRRRMAESPLSQDAEDGESGCLLIVGRGSPDQSATADMQEFAKRRQQQEGMDTAVAFLAMAQPLLQEQLQQLVAANYQFVIVQPHLLFAGELVDSLRQHVVRMARAHPKTEWLVTPLLADALGEVGVGTELLLEAMVDRCTEAVAAWR